RHTTIHQVTLNRPLTFWPPPTFPSLPYTTLFRSRAVCTDRPGSVLSGEGRIHPGGQEGVPRLRGAGRVPGVRARPAPRRRGTPSDRKSTRLNSSHQIISYAFLCLIKKNTTPRVPP